MTKKGKVRKKISPVEEAVNSAVDYGISAIIKQHPRFKNFKGVLSDYVDREKITQRARELYNQLREASRLDRDGMNYLHRQIASYVASGEAFDEAGQRVILKRGLEEKAKEKGILNFFSRRGAKEELEGIKYLDKKLNAYGKFHQALEESGGYNNMPELRRQLEYLSRAGFLHAALELSKEEGNISDKDYNRIRKSIKEGVEESRKEYGSKLEKYSQYDAQKIAAAVFAFLGIGIFISSGTEITGNIVGGTGGNIAGVFAGIFFLGISSVLFLRSFKN